MRVFIAGPRAVTKLNSDTENRLLSVVKSGCTVLVGDANGVDKLAQQYLFSQQYKNVVIYASNGKARNNLGSWPINKVEVDNSVKGFDFYACKDEKMAEDADYGFMIWNGKSKGTLNNIINLTSLEKKVLIYLIPHKRFYCISNLEDANKLASACNESAETLDALLSAKNGNASQKKSRIISEQLSLFT